MGELILALPLSFLQDLAVFNIHQNFKSCFELVVPNHLWLTIICVFEYLFSLKKTLLDNVLSKIQGDDRMRIKIILNFMTAV